MCNTCNYRYYIDLCDEMLFDDKYDFANDTIQGIYDWVKQNEHITDNQKSY